MQNFNTSNLHSRMIDITVLTITFLVFSLATNAMDVIEILKGLLVYVGIVFIALRLVKRMVFIRLSTPSRILRVLSGNFFGFVLGIAALLFMQNIFSFEVVLPTVAVFSSILAFFVLGTLSPMVKTSHSDIIHH